MKLGQIEQSRIKELAEAQRTGADINLINEKFNAQRVQLQEEYAKKQTDILAQEYAEKFNSPYKLLVGWRREVDPKCVTRIVFIG